MATCLWGWERGNVDPLSGHGQGSMLQHRTPESSSPDHTCLPGNKDPGLRRKVGPGNKCQSPWLLPGSEAALRVDAEGHPALPGCCCTPAQAPSMLHPNPELPGLCTPIQSSQDPHLMLDPHRALRVTWGMKQAAQPSGVAHRPHDEAWTW